MKHFCTLFDRNFLFRGLALYESCVEHCGENFTLWILCLDLDTKTLLEKMHLEHAVLLGLGDLNDAELAALRSTRGPAEFAWSSKPSLFLHVMKTLADGETLTYLDSDTFLFSSPGALYEKLVGTSLAITPHDFSPPDKEKEHRLGIYNAGWIYMRKDAMALSCLTHWRAQCIEWCFNRHEEGRFGDQKYLNEWPRLYPGSVTELRNCGVNVGPWNLRGHVGALVWYHFHGLKLYRDGSGALRAYPVSVLNPHIYTPYLAALSEAMLKIQKADPGFIFKTDPPLGLLRFVKQRVMKLLT